MRPGILAICFATFPSAAQPLEQPYAVWEPAYPEARTGYKITFDEARGKLILFGGAIPSNGRDPRRANLFVSETWEYDGRWQRVSTEGPSPRTDPLVFFSQGDNQTYVIGGNTWSPGTGIPAPPPDMWRWDGSAWEFLTASIPTGLSSANADGAFDPVASALVVNTGIMRFWSEGQWTSVNPVGGGVGPGFSTLLFDPVEGRLAAVNDQLRHWSGDRWTIATTPCPAQMLRGWTDADDHASLLISNSSVYTLAAEGFTQIGSLRPGANPVLQEFTYDSTANSLLQAIDSTIQIWKYDGVQWTADWQNSLSPHYGAVAAYDRVNDKTFMVIGSGTDAQRFFMYDGSQSEWLVHPTGLSRDYAGLVYDTARERIILHGGRLYSLRNTTYRITPTTIFTVSSQGPARWRHGMSYDEQRDKIVLFGGADNGAVLPVDTWEFDGTSWQQVSADGPPGRNNPGMTYDARRGVTVLFGGWQEGNPVVRLNDTWEWDGKRWVQVASNGPSHRSSGRMAYDADRGLCVLFGGANNEVGFADTWEWDGTRWQLVPAGGPVARWGHVFSYDTTRHHFVMSGGGTLTNPTLHVSDETWLLRIRSAPRGFARAPHRLTCPGSAAALWADAVGSSSITYQWRFQGQPLSDGPQPSGAMITGATSVDLLIENVQPADAGEYDCIVTNPYGQSTLEPAVLRLGHPADITGSTDPNSPDYGQPDGALDASDFFYFLDAFVAENFDIADLSGSSDPNDPAYGRPDGHFDGSDFFYFLDLFSQPCL